MRLANATGMRLPQRHDRGSLAANERPHRRAFRRRRPFTIIAYHSVGGSPGPYAISRESFARQIACVARHFTVVPLRTAPSILAAEKCTRRVALTFDDGFMDFLNAAYPILSDFHVPATVFVPTGFVGGHNDWDAPHAMCSRKPLLTEAQLRELSRSELVDVGSHTVGHVRMTECALHEARHQAADSKAALEDALGESVTLFSYPYGQLADYSADTAAILAEAGYEVAVTSHWGTRNGPFEILRLRRIFFREGDGERIVCAKVEGRYDWLGWKERAAYVARGWRRSPHPRPGPARTSS